ncbi:MAG: DUF2207 family protein [Terrabacter sp.]
MSSITGGITGQAMAYAAVPALVDRDTFVGATALGLVPLALAGLVVLAKWWRGRDQVFDDITPGLVPDDPVAHAHDVSATLVDLAVRGWFHIVEVGAERASPELATDTGRGRPRDWVLRRAASPPDEPPSAFEQLLLDRIFEGRDEVRLSSLKGSFAMTMREAQIGLYREVVDRGWYARHPRARNGRTRAIGLVVLVPLTLVAAGVLATDLVDASDWSLTPLLVGLVLALVALARWGGSRTPRTAEGSAMRIQALGFREYLATAEADRLSFEEKRALLSSYLPYAVAFGLTGHFAGLLHELAKDSHWADYVDGLDWYDFGGGDVDVSLGDALSDFGDAAGDLGGLGDLDVGDVFDGVDGFTDATDSLFSFDGLPGCGDGFDGCDGCDLPGCDF